MAFVKLLLVLAALTFGKNLRKKAREEDDDSDVYEPFVKGTLYYWPGSVDKDGVLTIDYKEIANSSLGPYSTKQITDFKAYGDGKADAETFETVPEADLSKKEVAKTIATKDATDCLALDQEVESNFYGQLGYTVFAIKGGDIAPSITGLIKNSPSKLTWKNLPENLTDLEKAFFQNQTLPQSCAESGYSTDSGLPKAGVTDAVCQPNGALPADADKCADGSKPKYFLKGYKQAEFGNADIQTLKDLLVRFGPVIIYGNAADPFDYLQNGLLVGWTKEGWIFADYAGSTATGLLVTHPTRVEGKFYGYVLINGVSVVRAALSLIAAVLVLPALLL